MFSFGPCESNIQKYRRLCNQIYICFNIAALKSCESKYIIFYLVVNSLENWNDKSALGFMYKKHLTP